MPGATIVAVIPVLLAVAGVVALGGGLLALRRVGPGYRVGRLLAAAPELSLAEAVEAAGADPPRYVRVEGRISSDEEFPDEHDRPLVFRRRRLELDAGDGWRTLEEERIAVPFGLEERTAFLAVDVEALDEGLVVLPRESTGRAAEVAERLPPGTPPEALVRHSVDQVSAVEHARACGVPRLRADGRAVLTTGLGRPLILTTLDLPEAMRVLGGRRRGSALAAATGLAAGGLLLVLAGLSALAGVRGT
jgi:hypothetical protein